METTGVQTEDMADDMTTLNSNSMGLFTDLLNILDDENRNIYYDESDTRLQEETSKWSVNADSGDESFDYTQSIDSCQDITSPSLDTDKMTTAELEHSVQLSEFRLRTNLAALAKLKKPEDNVRQWLASTSSNMSFSFSSNEGVQSPLSSSDKFLPPNDAAESGSSEFSTLKSEPIQCSDSQLNIALR
ncbi:unnamed protein product [Calicophoron daubneyi]|uniref:Uncharacterized protein n=1 Tax=Calicophoron daubneyi TaxID=300641 RepID=A0AAV2T738_CALDB